MRTAVQMPKSGSSTITRRTEAGIVRGLAKDGICRFLSIPYAAPPVGENRFREPQPVITWTGERDTSEAGPSAPHRIKDFPAIDVVPLVGTGSEGGEDYLTLNIWAPEAATGRPVMVFIHGGGFVVGSKDAPVSDGTEFARSGVVCVAINYRLGIEGWLPIPGVPTNLGMRDMIFALEWVQRNIDEFGGDPGERHSVRRIRRRDGHRGPRHVPTRQGAIQARDHRERPWRHGPRDPGGPAPGPQAGEDLEGHARTPKASARSSFDSCLESDGKGLEALEHRPARRGRARAGLRHQPLHPGVRRRRSCRRSRSTR